MTIDLGAYAIGFGCDVTAALGTDSEGVELAGLLDGEVVVTCQVASDGTDQFIGLACLVDQVRFRAASIVQGGVGEGFSIENVIVCGSEVAAATITIVGDAASGSRQVVRLDAVDGAGMVVDTSGAVTVEAGQAAEETASDLASAFNASPHAGQVTAVASERALARCPAPAAVLRLQRRLFEPRVSRDALRSDLRAARRADRNAGVLAGGTELAVLRGEPALRAIRADSPRPT
ncbi:MAG: hypothetical protein GY711_14690 [bacterium]|nr:hypothetical protein [bacterium]